MRECGECGETTSLGSGGTADAIVDARASRISQNYDGGSITSIEIQVFKRDNKERQKRALGDTLASLF